LRAREVGRAPIWCCCGISDEPTSRFTHFDAAEDMMHTRSLRLLACTVTMAAVLVMDRETDARTTLQMVNTAVMSEDMNSTNPPGYMIGTLWWPTVALGRLNMQVGIKHSNKTCTSKVPQCVPPYPTFGWDRAWPLALAPGQPKGDTWMKKTNFQFMVNGTYFYICSGTSFETADCQSTAGPIVSGGKLVIPTSQEHENAPQDVLVFYKNGTAGIVANSTVTASSVKNVAAAIGGNILFSGGAYNKNCDTNCHSPSTQEPRTVIAFDGLSATSNIYFLVIQPGRDDPACNQNLEVEGAKAEEVADYLMGLTLNNTKLQYGFMLDGGGSSTFVNQAGGGLTLSTPGDTMTVNGQCVAVYRPVTTVVGIVNVR
jgi:hypothetical protein